MGIDAPEEFVERHRIKCLEDQIVIYGHGRYFPSFTTIETQEASQSYWLPNFERSEQFDEVYEKFAEEHSSFRKGEILEETIEVLIFQNWRSSWYFLVEEGKVVSQMLMPDFELERAWITPLVSEEKLEVEDFYTNFVKNRGVVRSAEHIRRETVGGKYKWTSIDKLSDRDSEVSIETVDLGKGFTVETTRSGEKWLKHKGEKIEFEYGGSWKRASRD